MPQKTLITSNSGQGRQILDLVGAGLNSAGLRPDEGQHLICNGDRVKAEARRMFERLAVGLPASREAAREALGSNFFGIEEWRDHYGISFTKSQLAKVSQFPWGEKVLTAPCPFHSGEQVKDTHFAFLGVERRGKHPLNICYWKELHPASGQPRFCLYSPGCWYEKEPFANEVTCQLRWYLLLREIVPGSGSRTFNDQQAMLPPEYEIPSAVEEVTKHITCFKKTGVYLNPTRFGRVSNTSSDGHRVFVGNFDAGGLNVYDSWDDNQWYRLGVAASRKLDA